MTFDEQAATLDRKGIVGLLASHQQLTNSVDTLTARNAELKRQLDWLKCQIFGSKSERRFVDPDGRQLSLGEWKQEDAPASEVTVAEHQRRSRKQPDDKAKEDDLPAGSAAGRLRPAEIHPSCNQTQERRQDRVLAGSVRSTRQESG